MRNCLKRLAAAVIFTCTAQSAFPANVVFNVTSPSHGAAVPAGTMIQWSITATASGGDNLGLSLVSVDLIQAPANPSLIDLVPATAIPAGMEGFSRPQGICNPGPGGVGTGYGGTSVGSIGQRNLVQIGGAQNTFGEAGASIGSDANVDVGLGQSPGEQLIAQGSFVGPSVPGTYSFGITNLLANTLVAVNLPPALSPSDAAMTAAGQGSFSFTICRAADVNQDAAVTIADLSPFVGALLDPDEGSQIARCSADVNGDGAVDGADVQLFVDVLLT